MHVNSEVYENVISLVPFNKVTLTCGIIVNFDLKS